MFFKDMRLPLNIMLAFTALILAVGSFLGFPNDALLSGLFWTIMFLKMLLGVIEHVHSR